MEISNDGRNDAARPPISALFLAVTVTSACITILAAIAFAVVILDRAYQTPTAALATAFTLLTVAGWGLAVGVRIRDHIRHDNAATRRAVINAVTRVETLTAQCHTGQQQHATRITEYIDAAETRVTHRIEELAEDRYQAGRTEGHLKALRAVADNQPKPPTQRKAVNGRPGPFPLRG